MDEGPSYEEQKRQGTETFEAAARRRFGSRQIDEVPPEEIKQWIDSPEFDDLLREGQGITKAMLVEVGVRALQKFMALDGPMQARIRQRVYDLGRDLSILLDVTIPADMGPEATGVIVMAILGYDDRDDEPDPEPEPEPEPEGEAALA